MASLIIHPRLPGQQVIYKVLNRRLAFPDAYRGAYQESFHGAFLLWTSYYIGSLLAQEVRMLPSMHYHPPYLYARRIVFAPAYSIPFALVIAILDINASYRAIRSSLR